MQKQIVNWRTHLKFPEEARLTVDAKDLISKLLCNVDQRLGTKGAEEIKVIMLVKYDNMPQIYATELLLIVLCTCNIRSTPGSVQ